MTTPSPIKQVADLVSYRPDVAALPEGRIIRLSVNEGALGASPQAVAALAELPATMHRYPEQIDARLVEAIASTFGLNPALILPANGSDELISLLATAYLEAGDEAICTQYGFLLFPQAIRIAGGTPIIAPDDGLTVSVDSIIAAITPKTKLIFLANPNNPTGTLVPRGAIERLIAATPGHIVIVLDSAYAEYVVDASYTPGAEYVETCANVVMLRTFSKLFGLAALRLGWGYCPPGIHATLASIRGPFSVNAAASVAGRAAVLDRGFIARSLEHNRLWMGRMRDSITQAGFEVMPGEANFFLIRFADADEGRAAAGYLRECGILLRGMTPYGLPHCLRMSIGTAEEMEITAAAFKDLAQHLKEEATDNGATDHGAGA